MLMLCRTLGTPALLPALAENEKRVGKQLRRAMPYVSQSLEQTVLRERMYFPAC